MNNFGIFNTSSCIIDLGSDTIKAGLSTEDKPSLLLESLIGSPKYKKILPQNTDKQIIGISAETRGLYNLKKPIKRGILQNEEDAKLIFQKIHNELKLINNKEIPILIAEPPFTSKKQKNMISEILFETLECPNIFFATQGVLSLYSYGKTNGIILESGAGVSQVVPLYEGYKLDIGIDLVDFGGVDVDCHLDDLMKKNGNYIESSSRDSIVKEIKEKSCKISPTPLTPLEIQMHSKIPSACPFTYKLPNGDEITLTNETQISPEILFSPKTAGFSHKSLPKLLYDSVQRLDTDLRKTLFENVMLSGGNTCLEGFSMRFINDLQPMLGGNSKLGMTVSNFDKTFLVWQGGHIVSNIGSFAKLWISKKEYMEQGDRIFVKKQF